MLNQVIKRISPFLFLAHYSSTLSHGIATLCRLGGIPSLVAPMKSIVRFENEFEKFGQHDVIGRQMVQNVFTHVAIQTPYAAEYIEQVDFSGELIKSGPLVFPQIDPIQRTDLPFRLYADRHRKSLEVS